jgi:hypothetical protein
MKDYLEQVLRFPRHLLGFVDEKKGDLPAIFIDKKEEKNCLQFFFGYSDVIADFTNPYYNCEKAVEGAIDILWDGESVTTHAVEYLLENRYLPDVYNDPVLNGCCSPEQKRKDIDFLMRFWRRENY